MVFDFSCDLALLWAATIKSSIIVLSSLIIESDNFIGFSADSYSDGAVATVKIDSNITTQSSLTPVKTYYIQRDGTLGIAAATPSVLGGIALSSTKLLIDAHR